MRPLRRTFPFLAVLALTLAACTSGGSDVERSEDATTTTTTAAPGGAGEPAAEATEVLRLGLAGPTSPDPAAISPASVSSMILADLLHDTLTVVDAAGVPGPGLATFDTNEDQTVWRFQLRDGVSFADGSPVTAEDVVVSLDRVRSQGGASLAAIQLEDITEVVALGPSTLDIKLRAPSAVLPELLSSPLYGIVDADLPPTSVDAPLNPSGPFAVEAPEPDRLVLERRRGGGAEVVELRLFPDEARAHQAFVAGELDWSPVPVDQLGDVGDGREALVPFHGSVMLGVRSSAPPLDQPAVRRAIALAVDRGALTEAVFGPTARPMRGLIPAGVAGAAGECVDPCGPDVDRARALVAEAFPDGAPPIRLLTDDTTTQTAIAGVLERQLAAVGLEVEVTSVDPDAYAQQLRGGQTQLFLYSSIGVARTPTSHLLPWSSTSPDNVAGYGNELVDAAIAAAVTEPDPATRVARWREIEAAVLGDVPVVPLSQLRTVAVVGPRVEGVTVRADGSVDLGSVTFVDEAG